jgi:methylphosphotriester-DNA--protein-cysteine methyltransferase
MAAPGQMILPDGRLELIFHFATPPDRQPSTMLAGRMMRALAIHDAAPMNSLGIRLRPGAAHAFLPCELMGEVEDLEGVLGHWAKQTRERLGQATGTMEMVWRQLRKLKPANCDEAIQHSIAAMEIARGRGAVDAFLPDGLQTRQWQRRFLKSTGFTPKAFCRIIRLQSTIALVGPRRVRDWSALALEAGFYDQAHMNNEFRAFTGSTPERYFSGRLGMEDFYHDAFFQDDIHDSR